MAKSMKEHLSAFHKRASSHYRTMSKLHKNVGSAFGACAKMTKSDVEENDNPLTQDQREALVALAEAHDEMSDEAADLADFHLQAFDECQKVDEASDLQKLLDRLEPTQISAITPDNPMFRAVIRPGQREVPEDVPVAPGLEKVVGVSAEFLNED